MADSPNRGLRRMDGDSLSGSLGAVYRQARELAKLRQALASVLPEDEGRHLVGVSDNGRRLAVFADSPAWATRLRYRAPELEAAAERWRGIRPRLAFKVARHSEAAGHQERSPWLSEHVVNTLEASARTVEDEGLAQALRRLARGAAR